MNKALFSLLVLALLTIALAERFTYLYELLEVDEKANSD